MPAEPGPTPTLYVLPPSHYCERARWGLDHAGYAFREAGWAVGLHIPLARRLAPATTLPILVVGREVIQGSGRILDWAGLAGGDPAIEDRLERGIGPLVRQLVYCGTLAEPDCPVRAGLFHDVPPWQRMLGGLMWPVTRRAMTAGMRAEPSRLPGVADALSAELDWLDGLLCEGGWLAGPDFGRTDITAASLLSPLSRPAELPLYRSIRKPPPLDRILAGWADRPSLRWANAAYAGRRSGGARRG